MFDIYFFIFLIEIFLAAILVVYLKIADEWVVGMLPQVKKSGDEAVKLIVEIREDLIKLNKIFDFIRNFKTSNVRKVFLKALDIINVIMLFYPKCPGTVKATRFLSFKFFKALFLAFKTV